MGSIRRGNALVVLALVLLGGIAAAPAQDKKEVPLKTSHFTGKVIPLAELIAKDGTKLDADAAPHWLALVTDDGKVYPLVKDSISRLFFLDKTLHKRPMRILGRLIPGTSLLRVLSVHSLIQGKPHEVFYYCDICSIRRNELMICECCGGKMYLREEPLK